MVLLLGMGAALHSAALSDISQQGALNRATARLLRGRGRREPRHGRLPQHLPQLQPADGLGLRLPRARAGRPHGELPADRGPGEPDLRHRARGPAVCRAQRDDLSLHRPLDVTARRRRGRGEPRHGVRRRVRAAVPVPRLLPERPRDPARAERGAPRPDPHQRQPLPQLRQHAAGRRPAAADHRGPRDRGRQHQPRPQGHHRLHGHGAAREARRRQQRRPPRHARHGVCGQLLAAERVAAVALPGLGAGPRRAADRAAAGPDPLPLGRLLAPRRPAHRARRRLHGRATGSSRSSCSTATATSTTRGPRSCASS